MIAEDRDDDQRDRQGQPEGARSGGQKGEEDGLGCVGNRREVVAREDRQGLDLGQPLGALLVTRERAPEQDPACPCQQAPPGVGGLPCRELSPDDAWAGSAEIRRGRGGDPDASVGRPPARQDLADRLMRALRRRVWLGHALCRVLVVRRASAPRRTTGARGWPPSGSRARASGHRPTGSGRRPWSAGVGRRSGAPR